MRASKVERCAPAEGQTDPGTVCPVLEQQHDVPLEEHEAVDASGGEVFECPAGRKPTCGRKPAEPSA
jgi:hypothetical protein